MSKSKINEEMYDFLAETARLAGEELTKRQALRVAARTKSDTSIVTEADLASEAVIIDRIRKKFPDDIILAEESGLSRTRRTPGEMIWVIDPLDGTTNYANGYPFYCISIARAKVLPTGKLEVVCGCVYDVPRSRLYYAGRGEGAYVNKHLIQAAAERDFGKALLVTGFYYTQGDELKSDIEKFAKIAELCQSIRRDGAAALDLAMVAEGVFDAFWEKGLQPWDVAAGSLLVAEAGGKVQNYPGSDGSTYNIEGLGIVAGSSVAVSTIAQRLW